MPVHYSLTSGIFVFVVLFYCLYHLKHLPLISNFRSEYMCFTICHISFVMGVAREAGCVCHIQSTQHHFSFGTFLHSCTFFIMSLILVSSQDCQCCIIISSFHLIHYQCSLQSRIPILLCKIGK